MSDADTSPYHRDPRRFRDALAYSEASRQFRALLIEKDYYCSLVLKELEPLFGAELVFKGGTSLSKVHSDFVRMSEDLDFSISVSPNASPGKRRRAANSFKALFADLVSRSDCFKVAAPLTGHNQSRQYNVRLAYQSAVTGQDEFLKIEVGLREEVLYPPERLAARTLLADPNTDEAVLAPFSVQVLTRQEAYAEKVRAALTRTTPAIRDFFDVDNAVQGGLISPLDEVFVELLERKLSVTKDPVDLSSARVEKLRNQLDAQLRPVLRQADYDAFLLDRVVALLERVAGKV
jgi:predicted nucleotidyltransferase component of viral defense system